MKQALALILSILILYGCSKSDSDPISNDEEQPPPTFETIFTSGFEPGEEDLPDGDSWTGSLVQNPAGTPESFIEVTEERSHTGIRSTKMFAPDRQFDPEHNREFCGKAALKKTNFMFREGETYRFNGWFYLTDPVEEAFFFLLDIECTEDECGIMGAPGVRVRIPDDSPHLEAEWKFLNYFSDASPPDSPPGNTVAGSHNLPVNEWFKVSLELKLGVGSQGVSIIYFNDEVDSKVTGTNVNPGGVLSGMNRYDSFEIGLTCNSTGSIPTTIYIDDISVEKLME